MYKGSEIRNESKTFRLLINIKKFPIQSLSQKELEKQDSFLLFFCVVFFGIYALDPVILKHSNPITEEDDILVLQKLLHSTDDYIIVSRIVTMQVGFEFRKQEDIR